LRKEDIWKIGDTWDGKFPKPNGNTRFHTFEDALGKVEEFSTNLGSNVSITQEDDATFAFFRSGPVIATWICGNEEDDLQIHGIYREPNPKKGYLRKEEEWKR
jgi:hypothetical protein